MLSMKEQSSVSAIHSSARPWQQRMAQELQAIHSFSYHAYAQAPTGVGKTYLMALYGEDFVQGDGVRLIIVGRKDLVSQHQRALKELYKEGKLQNINKWRVITWQAATRIAKEGEFHPLFSRIGNPDILFFDECHLGGSSSKAKSIPIIKFGLKPRLWLNVSATTWDVNEGILGKREGFLSSLSYEEAYKEGYLNPVVLNRVDVGMEMTLKAKKIEEMTGIPFYNLAEKTPEEVAVELKRIGREEGINVTARDVEDVVYFRIRTLIELYAEKHIGEKAIFWTPNTHYVEYARTYFDKVMVRKKGKGVWSHAFHSKNDYADNAKVRDDFVNNDTKRVMFVCHMLTEGFDFPELSLLFDASFNPSNIRRMLQKIGRALRIIYGWNVGYGWKKPVSQFYYAVDVRHILSHSGRQLLIRDDFQTPGSLQGLSDSDIRFGTEAIADRMALIQSVDGEGKESSGASDDDFSVTDAPVTVESVGVEDVDGEEKSVRVARIPFFEVEDVSGKENRGRMAFRDVFRFKCDSSGKKKELISLGKTGIERSELSKVLRKALVNYTSNGGSQDMPFTTEIKRVAPHWFINTADVKKKELIDLGKTGIERNELSEGLRVALSSYTNKGDSQDIPFTTEIKRVAPQWFINTADVKKKELIALGKTGIERGKLSEGLRVALNNYTNKGGSQDIPFTTEIKKVAPQWFISTADVKKKELIDLGKTGVERGKLSEELYCALTKYTNKGGSQDIPFTTEIKRVAPHWFINTADVKKKELISLGKTGIERSELSEVLRKALSSYTCSTHNSYDTEFHSKIKKVAPQWFISTADVKKKELISLGKTGIERSELSEVLRKALKSYTSNGGSQDIPFTTEIKKVAPQWFISTADVKKKELISLGKTGIERSELSKVLRKALNNYTSNGGSQDIPFTTEIKRVAPHWFINTADVKKKELIALGKTGIERDELSEGLRVALSIYTNKGDSQDIPFTTEIKRVAPQWFINTADVKKKELIALGKTGIERGKLSEGLRVALSSYTNKGGSQDIPFTTEIKKVAPHWFINTADVKKKELISLGKTGVERGKLSERLRVALKNYTGKGGSQDMPFTTEIKRVAPHWFINTADVKKKELISLGKTGIERSELSEVLRKALKSYTSNGGSQDIPFTTEIKKVAPHWFINTADVKKKELIALGKTGIERGKLPKDLNSALVSYTSSKHSSYDTGFNSEIRLSAKHWFKAK